MDRRPDSRAGRLLRSLLVWYAAAQVGALLALPEGYIGTKTCGACHPNQYAAQSKSHHAEALQTGAAIARFPFLPTKPVRENSDPKSARFEFRKGAREFLVKVTLGGRHVELPIDWIMGANDQGLTFFSRLPGGEFLEHRLTYYRRIGNYDITPGQSIKTSETVEHAFGLPLTAASAFQCLRCHSTYVKQTPNGPDYDSVLPGVTCERCHGPGAQHVRAIRSNAADRKIQNPGKLSGDELVLFCGECHRTEPPPGTDFDAPIVARFQPVGLQMSACFQKSNGAINCLTCHNPHENARREDDAFYNGRCLGCHGAQSTQRCKIRPTDGCVGCHLPKLTPVPHVRFADHWIRVRQ
jgi:hypothetical protein